MIHYVLVILLAGSLLAFAGDKAQLKYDLEQIARQPNMSISVNGGILTLDYAVVGYPKAMMKRACVSMLDVMTEAYFEMTPAYAREVAAQLLDAANKADSINTMLKSWSQP